MGARPTELVKSKFGKATTADQLPEMDGATSGSVPSRKGPTAGRMVIPKGLASVEKGFAPAGKIKPPNNARTNNPRHCARNGKYNLFTDTTADKILRLARTVKLLCGSPGGIPNSSP